jgi:hypothetical protein
MEIIEEELFDRSHPDDFALVNLDAGTYPHGYLLTLFALS